jgi:hypothetical protein
MCQMIILLATAVNQQNVTATYPQQQSQQNGGTGATFTPSTQSVAPLGAPIKYLKPPLIKTQDFPTSNLSRQVSMHRHKHPSNATGMVMLNNSVNVQQSAGIVRTPGGAISLSQQQLGNIVLAMAVPPSTAALNSNLIQPSAPSVPVQPVVRTITVPFGWKRLHINGAIVYIRLS